jgi:protease-4
MTQSADSLYDRIILKSKLLRWKCVAIFTLMVLLVVLSTQKTSMLEGNDYIARVFIDDIILENFERDTSLQDIADNKKIKAVIVHIDSPGGSSAGSEMLYTAIREIAKVKPVVTVMGTSATSGGYMAAIAADYILANAFTITGSIGVIMQSYEYTELAKKAGIHLDTFKSGELKATPNEFEVTTPAIKAAIDETIIDSANVFLSMVQTRRNLSAPDLNRLRDGRVFTGNQALKYKLIDEIGNEKQALTWLKDKKKVADLSVKEVKLVKEQFKLNSILDRLDMITNFFSKQLSKSKQLLSIW